MELEDLKSIWKSSEPAFQPKNETEIASMLTGRSRSIIEKLKRNVWFELVLTLAVSVALLVYALALTPGMLKWAFISILLICLAYTFYYIKKLMLLNRFNPANENIHANLVSLIDSLTGYLKFYRRSYSILYPLYFGLVLLLGAIERGTAQFLEHLSKPKTIAYLLTMAAVVFFLCTSFTNWYLKKLYGNHLDKLKGLLKDLEQ
jgi:hypothetical protein